MLQFLKVSLCVHRAAKQGEIFSSYLKENVDSTPLGDVLNTKNLAGILDKQTKLGSRLPDLNKINVFSVSEKQMAFAAKINNRAYNGRLKPPDMMAMRRVLLTTESLKSLTAQSYHLMGHEAVHPLQSIGSTYPGLSQAGSWVRNYMQDVLATTRPDGKNFSLILNSVVAIRIYFNLLSERQVYAIGGQSPVAKKPSYLDRQGGEWYK